MAETNDKVGEMSPGLEVRKEERLSRISGKMMAKPLQHTEAKSRKDGKFLLVMPYALPQVWYLNWTAATFYRAIDGKRTGNDLADALAAKFPDVPRATIDRDIAEFIVDMLQCRVLQVAR